MRRNPVGDTKRGRVGKCGCMCLEEGLECGEERSRVLDRHIG
jgi:hypothetical protein